MLSLGGQYVFFGKYPDYFKQHIKVERINLYVAVVLLKYLKGVLGAREFPL